MSKLTDLLHDMIHHLPIRHEKQEELHEAVDELETQRPKSAEASKGQ